MAFWCGAAFGFGVALMFTGLRVIPVSGDDALLWLKWGGAAIGLCGCIGAYIYRKRAAVDARGTPRGE